MVRTYGGDTQAEVALLYAEDAPKMAADGWIPVSQAWVADEWPASMWILATVLVIVGIGIVILFAMAFFKPRRTLMVTYARGMEGLVKPA